MSWLLPNTTYGDTKTLTEKYSFSGNQPNLTDAAMVGMPKNAGKPRLGNPRLRKAKKKASGRE